MNFELSEDQKLLQGMARDFATKELAPLAAQHDRLHAIDEGILKQMRSLGFFGCYLPEEFGGAEMDFLSYAILIEEISKACASTGVVISAHTSLCCNPIATFGSQEQKQNFLPKLTSGEKIGCFLLSEPEAGSDVAGLQTRYLDQGDHYRLNGSKIFITNGGFLGTGIVFATQDPALGYKGISAFMVDLTSPGVTLTKNEDKLGIRGSYTSAFSFDQVKVPKGNLLGSEGDGFKIAMDTLNGGRIGIASQALGIGQAALDMAIEYSMERKQFNKTLAQFQAIQFKLADISMRLESARLVTYRAAWQKENHKDYTMTSAMAKTLASEAANFAAKEALQIYGGYGYSTEFPLERLYRDAKITEIYEGTSEVQRIVIAKELIKKH